MEHQTPSNPSVTPKVTPNEPSHAALLDVKGDNTEPETPTVNPLLEEEMVIEEVSIDGMCGVY